MKLRNTLLLASIGAGLFAYIWFVDRHQSSTREAEETSAKVLEFERDKVTSLTIRNAGASPTPLVLRKTDGIWSMEQPLADRADSGAIEQLLSLLNTLRHDSKIDLPPGKETEQLKEFGVAESDLSIKATMESGKDWELLIGKDTAIEGKVYVRAQGKNTVYAVPNRVRTQLTKKTDDFRDHRLSTAQVQAVQKLSIKTGGGVIEIERTNRHWDIRKPLHARAADSKVNDLIAGLLTANVSQFLPETPTTDQGLAEARATVTFQMEGSKDPVILQIGNVPAGDENKDKAFSKISSRKAVTVIPSTAIDPVLKLRPNDIRDRKLVRLEPDIVDRITIEPADKAPIILARKGESWIRKEGEKESPIREGLASKILADIQAAEAVNFVADMATDLAQYGLERPNLKVRLSSFASENTAESKAGEKSILSLFFAKVEGESAYAKMDEEPFIVAAPKFLIESIPVDRFGLRVPSAPEPLVELNVEEIKRIEFFEKELPPLVLTKKDTGWTAEGERGELIPSAVQEVVTKVAALHGERLSDAAFEEAFATGFAKPELTVKLTLAKEGKETTHVLMVCAAGKDGLSPAKTNSKENTYLISTPDREVLGKKLFRQ